MATTIIVDGNVTTVTVRWFNDQWYNIINALNGATTPIVTVDIKGYTDMDGRLLEIPTQIMELNMIGNNSMVNLNLQLKPRTTEFTMTLDNINSYNQLTTSPLIDIANSLNNKLILKNINNLYNNGTTNTAAGIGGGYKGGAGFIYISEETNIVFNDTTGNLPVGYDIGDGYEYTGTDSHVFVAKETFEQSLVQGPLTSLELKLGDQCKLGAPFTGPLKLIDTTGNPYGPEFLPSSTGYLMACLMAPGTYSFSSNYLGREFNSTTFNAPLTDLKLYTLTVSADVQVCAVE